MTRLEALNKAKEDAAKRQAVTTYQNEAAEGIATILDNARTDAEQLGVSPDECEDGILTILQLSPYHRHIAAEASPKPRTSRPKKLIAEQTKNLQEQITKPAIPPMATKPPLPSPEDF